MEPPLARRALAELCGTAFLVAIVIGSGIAAQRLSPSDTGLQLLQNAAATGAGLVALILAFGAVSGAHLNPVVTLVDAAFGGIEWRAVPAYIGAQMGGGALGAVVANLMFELPWVELAGTTRSGGGLWLGEVVATLGLLLVVFGVVRSGRSGSAPFAVGAYIASAYYFTSSTSFANPAVTFGRTLSDTFAGIAVSSALPFVAAQLLGAALALVLIRALYPDIEEVAGDVVVPAHSEKPEILVVCTHNAGRSVAARLLLDHHGRGRVTVRSAGSAPGEAINPSVAAVLAERGLDASKEFPKRLTDEAARAADIIITMGCGDACPVYAGKRYLDWELRDPAGLPVDEVRPIVDEIERRVLELLDQLLAGPSPNG